MFASRLTIVVSILSILIYLFLHRTSIQLVFHPDRYHGDYLQHGIYFEGWYFKLVLNDYDKTMVVIPGVHMNDDNRHSFIMVAYENVSHYFRFPFEAFASSSNEFLIRIDGEENLFSYEQLRLNLQANTEDNTSESFQMNLTLSSHVYVPDLSWLTPGTMGPYSWIPTMQCYHHVLSMNHDIHGTIRIDQHDQRNISGVGYIEKDWGHSFPSIWIWGQANQWENVPSTASPSLFFSFALIPWYFNLEFAGFLVVFEYQQEFYRFNTYLQSVVEQLSVNNQTNEVSFDVYDVSFEYKLHLSTFLEKDAHINSAMLHGPRHGRMEKYVREILSKNIHFDVQLSKLIHNSTSNSDNHDNPFLEHGYHEEILFQGRALNIALEITGDVHSLQSKFRQTYENIYPWKFSFIRSLIHGYRFVVQTIYSLLKSTKK